MRSCTLYYKALITAYSSCLIKNSLVCFYLLQSAHCELEVCSVVTRLEFNSANLFFQVSVSSTTLDWQQPGSIAITNIPTLPQWKLICTGVQKEMIPLYSDLITSMKTQFQKHPVWNNPTVLTICFYLNSTLAQKLFKKLLLFPLLC